MNDSENPNHHLEQPPLPEEPIDWGSEEMQIGASEDTLRKINGWVQKADELKARIEKGEKLLKQLQTELEVILYGEIPELLATVNLRGLPLQDGRNLIVKDEIFCGIPKTDDAKRRTAFKWLIDNGYGEKVKTTLTVAMGAGDREEAKRVESMLQEGQVNYTAKEDIHANSLRSIVTEHVNLGTEDLPREAMGVYVRKVTQFK